LTCQDFLIKNDKYLHAICLASSLPAKRLQAAASVAAQSLGLNVKHFSRLRLYVWSG
jgi:hypothetical protein